MDSQTIVAITAAAISILAMGVAIWQASEARRARTIADDQARTARAALQETQTQTRLAQDANTQSRLNLDAAEKAAEASRAGADEARKANELTRQQHARDEQAETAAALAEARKVTCELGVSRGFSILVRNDSAEPVFQVELEQVEWIGHPERVWQLNSSPGSASTVWDRLGPRGSEREFYLAFAVDGETLDSALTLNEEFVWTISFSDAYGRRWRRTEYDDPVVIET